MCNYAADRGAVIMLNEDVTVSYADTAISIGSGKSVTLDLNGRTVDRNLKEMNVNGYVFFVQKGATRRSSLQTIFKTRINALSKRGKLVCL